MIRPVSVIELTCHLVTTRPSLLRWVRCQHLSSRPCFVGQLPPHRNVTLPLYYKSLVSNHFVVKSHESISRNVCVFRHHFLANKFSACPVLQARTFLKHPKPSLEFTQSEKILVGESRLMDTSGRQWRGIFQTHGFSLNPALSFTLCSSLVVVTNRYFSMKRKDYMFPELKPDDLEEMYVRGSGPGGQAVNQTSNCVVLKHKPTGIVVKCHETRSLEENRKIARKKLEEKLDLHLHGANSFLSQVEEDSRQNKQEKKRRANKRLALKRALKEQENSE